MPAGWSIVAFIAHSHSHIRLRLLLLPCQRGVNAVVCASTLPLLSGFLLSHGVLLGPLLGGLDVLVAIRLVDAGNFRHERVLRVCVGEQRANAEQHL